MITPTCPLYVHKVKLLNVTKEQTNTIIFPYKTGRLLSIFPHCYNIPEPEAATNRDSNTLPVV